MSNKVITWAKANPGKSVLILGGLGVAIWLVLNAGNDGGGIDGGVVYAGGGMTAADYQLALQGQQINAQLSATQIGANTSVALATIDQQTQIGLAQKTIELASENNAASLALGQMTTALQLQNILSSADVANQQTQANLQLGMEAQQTTRSAIESSMQQAISTNQTYAQIMQGQADIQIQQVLANRDVQIKQSDNELAKVVNTNNNATKQNRSNNKTSTALKVIGAAAAFFCDVRIKTLHECIPLGVCGNALDTIPLDRWVYIAGSVGDDGGKTHVGTYAQDFYRALGAPDAEERTEIDAVDLIGVMMGAIREGRKHER